jgi:L-asparagine transporter-like permease
LLILAVLAGPFIGVALTSGRPRLIFTYVAGAMVILFFLLWLIAMLATRRGREALAEGCADGCLDAILGGLLGGG